MKMTLQPIDYVNGISSLIYVIVNIIIGLIIVLKYPKLGDKTFIFIGIGIMTLSEQLMPSSASFIWNLMFGEGLSLETYIIIGNVFIPIGILCWLKGFTDLIYPKKQKLILIIYLIIGIIFEIILFTLLIVDPTLIGVFSAEDIVHMNNEYKTFLLGYLLFMVATALITGIIFAKKSLKSEDRVIKFKGKFILIAFLTWSIGSLFDAALPLNLIILPIIRLLLVSSSLLLYLGFIMPQKIKNLILKK